MKKRFPFLAVVVALFCLCNPAKLFLIGEPLASEQILCTAQARGETLHLELRTADSAAAFRSWKTHQEGTDLYITARKVLVSPIFDTWYHEMAVDIQGVNQVYLGGAPGWTRE